jgi:hypothetical protein
MLLYHVVKNVNTYRYVLFIRVHVKSRPIFKGSVGRYCPLVFSPSDEPILALNFYPEIFFVFEFTGVFRFKVAADFSLLVWKKFVTSRSIPNICAYRYHLVKTIDMRM